MQPARFYRQRFMVFLVILGICILYSGCAVFHHKEPPCGEVPNEAMKTLLPPYVISPPDVLQINAVQLIPRPPYKIKPLDVILVQFPAQPELLKKEDLEALLSTGRAISGNFTVEPEGTVNLGAVYGKVSVYNMTLDEARAAVEAKLKQSTNPALVQLGKVMVDLVQSGAKQQILGDHLVRPDGSISLGTYGDLIIAGETIPGAKAKIEAFLSQYLVDPEVSVDVSGFNSQVYYVIFDGAGYGEQVMRLPVTGNETVLDAIGQVQGLSSVASCKHIWVARPSQAPCGKGVKLPVNWRAITRCADTATNYQVLPGDRIYVKAQPIITADTYVARYLSPVQRLMGYTMLGSYVYRTLRFMGSIGGGGFGGGFGGFR